MLHTFVDPLLSDICLTKYEVCKLWKSHYQEGSEDVLSKPPNECRDAKGAADATVAKWTDVRIGNKYYVPYAIQANSRQPQLGNKARQAIEKAVEVYDRYTNIKFVEKTVFEQRRKRSNS